MKKTNEQPDRRAKTDADPRRRIVGAAMQAFLERGYGGTSTLEIATRAGVSKRDLYAHFANKHAMLEACVSERTQRMRLSLELPRATDLEGLGQVLRAFAAAVLRETTRPEVTELFRLAIAEADRSPELARELYLSGSAANREALKELLTHASDSGMLTGDPAVMVTRFLSLVWDDLRVQLLLRTSRPPNAAEIARRAAAATDTLLLLHSSTRGTKASSR